MILFKTQTTSCLKTSYFQEISLQAIEVHIKWLAR